MKTGLVLEGGAMRGMYTAGVLDVLMDHGIGVDLAVGVSAGALFGVNFLSGQRGRAIRYSKRFCRDKNYLGALPLLREGNIVGTKLAYGDIPHWLDPFNEKAFESSGVPFYAVVTDVATGEAEYIRIRSVFRQMDALRASGSMPFVSRPVEWEGRKYLDGGIADSIPFAFAQREGCDKLIVVLTQDADYVLEPMSPALPTLWFGRKSAVTQKLLCRHEAYERDREALKELEAEGRAFVFRPSAPVAIKMLEKDPEKLQETYDLGVRDAEMAIGGLKAFLCDGTESDKG